MRSSAQRREAICWVLRHGTIGTLSDLEYDYPYFSVTLIARICGMPQWLVNVHLRQLISQDKVEKACAGQRVGYRFKREKYNESQRRVRRAYF